MKFYNIPPKVSAFIFDIDGTLYTSAEYVEEQVDAQIRHWADLNGMSHDEGRARIAAFRKEYEESNGGKKISLGNAFLNFGITIDTSIEWRNSLLHPELYLQKNPALKKALESLSEKYTLVCVTNNPVDAARKTLEAVGIDSVLPLIVGLDTCRKSKPHEAIIQKALEIAGVPAAECVSVGDRFDIDLRLPIEMGMGGVLVDGAEDVAEMCEKFLCSGPF